MVNYLKSWSYKIAALQLGLGKILGMNISRNVRKSNTSSDLVNYLKSWLYKNNRFAGLGKILGMNISRNVRKSNTSSDLVNYLKSWLYKITALQGW